MILISQDGFKAFNMEYIKSYQITEDTLGKTPTIPPNDEEHKYIIWVDPHPFWENRDFYIVGKFKTLEDAQKVFNKLTSITNTGAEGCVIIKDNDVDFFGKDLPIWRN